MIDFIKIQMTNKSNFQHIIKGNESNIYTLKDYHFNSNNYDTNYYPIKGNINGMNYKITEKQAYICNSLHKYYNLIRYGVKNNNYSDFTFDNVVFALNQLKNDYKGYNFDDTKIITLEFGVNIETNKPPKQIIENNIKFYKRRIHNTLKDSSFFSMKKFEYQDYVIKFYDKGLESHLDKNLMRVEVVYHSKELKRLSINNINDLYDITIHQLLIDDFKKKIRKTLIVDDYYHLDKKNRDYLYKHLNIDYWKNYTKSKRTLEREYHRFIDFIECNSLNTTSKKLTQSINDKFTLLYTPTTKQNVAFYDNIVSVKCDKTYQNPYHNMALV